MIKHQKTHLKLDVKGFTQEELFAETQSWYAEAQEWATGLINNGDT
jgi:hypothetical protein